MKKFARVNAILSIVFSFFSLFVYVLFGIIAKSGINSAIVDAAESSPEDTETLNTILSLFDSAFLLYALLSVFVLIISFFFLNAQTKLPKKPTIIVYTILGSIAFILGVVCIILITVNLGKPITLDKKTVDYLKLAKYGIILCVPYLITTAINTILTAFYMPKQIEKELQEKQSKNA